MEARAGEEEKPEKPLRGFGPLAFSPGLPTCIARSAVGLQKGALCRGGITGEKRRRRVTTDARVAPDLIAHPSPRPAAAVWGKCTHCFHMHCILKWIESEQARDQCPMCRQHWEFN